MKLRKKASQSLASTVESPISSRMDGGEMAVHARARANSSKKGSHAMFLRKKLEEANLHQMIRDKMAELRVDFITLCRIAHVRQFGTDPDQTQSYINWVQHGLVPTFLEQWLNEQ